LTRPNKRPLPFLGKKCEIFPRKEKKAQPEVLRLIGFYLNFLSAHGGAGKTGFAVAPDSG
jgi:hypothetical protein